MNISPAIQKTFSRSVLQVQKHSPQILTAVGIAGLITAGVLAAKNTLKLEATVDTSNARLRDVKEAVDDGTATQKDVNRVVITNTYDLAKLYWMPITLATGSVISILVGHKILHERNLAAIAAYKSVEQAFANYRQRVIEEHGTEADEKYRYGLRDVEETVNGKKVKSLAQDENADTSGYVYVFEPGNDNWTGRHEHNIFFLQNFELIHNDNLKARGHVFLNDVLRSLGFEDNKQGAVTGWVWNQGTGDDYVDFGIKALEDGRILLNFNVDGIILDHI